LCSTNKRRNATHLSNASNALEYINVLPLSDYALMQSGVARGSTYRTLSSSLETHDYRDVPPQIFVNGHNDLTLKPKKFLYVHIYLVFCGASAVAE
jgi:hypothetical protein